MIPLILGYFLSLFSFCCFTSNPETTSCEVTSPLFGSLLEKWDLKWKEPCSSGRAGLDGSVWNCPSMNTENWGKEVKTQVSTKFCRLPWLKSFLPHPSTPVGLGNLQSVIPASSLWQKKSRVHRKREITISYFKINNINTVLPYRIVSDNI